MSKIKSVEERVSAEREAHEDRDILAEGYHLKNRFPHIFTYPSRRRLKSVLSNYLLGLSGRTVLDYGCGRGEASLEYLAHGATVFGMDIAQNYIAAAIAAAMDAGFSAERFKFEVMDAHRLSYDANTFDIVIGNGILHHLDVDVAMMEIYRVLKPGGRALMWEPLADNPLLKLFRWLTPNARTEDEKPFSGKDIVRLIDENRWSAEMGYCGLVEAPVSMLTSIMFPKKPDNRLLQAADAMERWLHDRRVLDSWNQYILFNLVKQ